jgi:hypothetical protein
LDISPPPPLTVSRQASPALSKELVNQSNTVLRDYATRFVGELRRFEAKFDIDDQKQQNLEWNEVRDLLYSNDPDRLAKASKKGHENVTKYYERRKLHEEDFNTRYRPTILAYREEICKREEFTSPCETHSTKQSIAGGLVDPIAMELDNGILAGINPIMQIADYLDKIIRNLSE